MVLVGGARGELELNHITDSRFDVARGEDFSASADHDGVVLPRLSEGDGGKRESSESLGKHLERRVFDSGNLRADELIRPALVLSGVVVKGCKSRSWNERWRRAANERERNSLLRWKLE